MAPETIALAIGRESRDLSLQVAVEILVAMGTRGPCLRGFFSTSGLWGCSGAQAPRERGSLRVVWSRKPCLARKCVLAVRDRRLYQFHPLSPAQDQPAS